MSELLSHSSKELCRAGCGHAVINKTGICVRCRTKTCASCGRRYICNSVTDSKRCGECKRATNNRADTYDPTANPERL